jgi:streptogramin lyase
VHGGPVTGQQFGAYRLHGLIGRGGMGIVYRAEHEHLSRTVALKLLTPELAATEGFRDRFMRESRLAASLDHPSIVTVYDAGEVNGTLYIAMRFVDGTDLAEVLRTAGPLPPDRALALLEQVAAALDAAHERGLVHRDVKPGNVMIEGARSFLTDFGLTKHQLGETTALTATGMFLGTVDYVAPEQIEARAIDGRADVYALGCVLYECLTGQRPYPRDSQVAVLYAHLKEAPPRTTASRSGLPPAIDSVIGKAMAKKPEDRYATCGEFVQAARAALAPASETATHPVPTPSTSPVATPPGTRIADPTVAAAPRDGVRSHRPRRRRGLVVAALAALAAVAAIAFALSSGGEESAPPDGTPQVADTIPVGRQPVGVTLAEGDLWVTNSSDATVTRVSPDGSDSEEIDVGQRPWGIGSALGSVWVVNSGETTVQRIDASSGQTDATLQVRDLPLFIAVDERRAFITHGDDDSVSELNASSAKEQRAPFGTGSAPRGIAIADGAIFVANSGDNTVSRIERGTTQETFDVGADPRLVAADGDETVWVTNKGDGTVSRIDIASGKVMTTRVGSEPLGIAVGEGYVWVTNSGEDTVVRLDPDTGERVGDPIDVPGQPVGVTVAEGSVWVTANDGNEVVRIEP